MLNKPKNCTDRPKTREMGACARKVSRMANPAIKSKATASTVILIATGNLRQGRLMANHGRLCSTTKLRQKRLKVAKAGCARVAFPIVKGEREGELW